MNILNRLNKYRENASKRTEAYAKNYKSDIVFDWRSARYPVYKVLQKSSLTRSKVDKGVVYIDSFEESCFNVVDDAHKLANLNHTGWYTDSFQNDTLIPVVLSFRHPHKLNDDGGHEFYLAATKHSDWDGVTIYTDCCYDTKKDAAYAADREAEIESEKCRDADIVYQAEQQISEKREEIHQINQEALPLIAEIKKHGDFSVPICNALRKTVESLLDDREQAFKRIATLTEYPFKAVTN